MSLEQEVELIRQFPIFSKIQPAMQKLLCFSSERLKYDAGQVMFNAGDAADAAYIIIDGSVEISVPPPAVSKRVVAGKITTVSRGGSSIIELSTMSWWRRVPTRSRARATAGGSGRVSRKLPPTIQKTSRSPR